MIGAIAGDIIGSVYEFNPIKTTDFPLFTPRSVFTDDTVLTMAVAHSILEGEDYTVSLKKFARRYPSSGYGGLFCEWMMSSENMPYNSWGNGSAMRVSPVGFAFGSEKEVLEEAKKSAEVTHNHHEGIKGAQATALAIFLARTEKNRERIRDEISGRFGYDLDRTLDEIRPHYGFDESCQGTVPESIIAFLESGNFEEAVRNAVSLGGDSDTLACITGGIAQAFYEEVPEHIISNVMQRLPGEFLEVIEAFRRKFSM